jgi:hypothetical protein
MRLEISKICFYDEAIPVNKFEILLREKFDN